MVDACLEGLKMENNQNVKEKSIQTGMRKEWQTPSLCVVFCHSAKNGRGEAKSETLNDNIIAGSGEGPKKEAISSLEIDQSEKIRLQDQ